MTSRLRLACLLALSAVAVGGPAAGVAHAGNATSAANHTRNSGTHDNRKDDHSVKAKGHDDRAGHPGKAKGHDKHDGRPCKSKDHDGSPVVIASPIEVVTAALTGVYGGDGGACDLFDAAGKSSFVAAVSAAAQAYGAPVPGTCAEAASFLGQLSEGTVTSDDVLALVNSGSLTETGATAQFVVPGQLTLKLTKQADGSWLISDFVNG